MKTYIIKVNGQQYLGLFACGCDAVVDALERFPHARTVSARVAQ